MTGQPPRFRRPQAALVLIVAGLFAPARLAADDRVSPVPWPAIDALGRALPMPDEVGAPRDDRFVGIFYFLWHDQPGKVRRDGEGPLDVAKILARDPDALRHPDSPLWGGIGQPHYWGEPLLGYYLAADPWVIRRHARLLTLAGVDTLIFDATNTATYPAQYTALCETFEAIRKEGGRTPRIAFMVNTQAGATANRLYNDLYKPGRFRELWFQWKGKPLLICDPAEAGPELMAFFTLRRAHWPFTMVNTRDAWHWEAAYPQPFGYTDDPNQAEQVNVSVAQNLRASDGKVTNMSNGDARGRGFHDGRSDHDPAAIDRGANFEEQWRRVKELDPPFVMVTGWNEWIAGRFRRPGEPVAFVDQFSREYSRDVEPMKGGHGDNFYYQLVANVRRYKGVDPLPPASTPRTIDVAGALSQWDGVGPTFTDDAGDTVPRDFDGAGGLHHADHSGRNDLVACKVARDSASVAFYARAKAPLSPRTDPGWMWLLIDADHDPKTGWEGYDFVVNRTVDTDGTSWLEKNDGGWKWSKVAPVNLRADGRELQLVLPRKVLGWPEGDSRLTFDFKWADNLQHPGEILDVYRSGDVAPEGRFNFRYDTGRSQPSPWPAAGSPSPAPR